MFRILFFILLGVSVSFSQEYIQSKLIYRKQTSQPFTNEWQYVSTDLYLLNGSRFTYLIRKTNPTGKKRRFKRKEFINQLLVTAQIQGLKGYENITYPIFSYQVTLNEDGDYEVNANESEVLRIIDNFPVSSINDQISAKIQIQAFTNQNKSELYKFVAQQLQNISSIQSSPTDAVFSIVGEFGKLLEKDASGQQYHFESTIRVYEDQNFNKRFHSLSIFVLKPSQKNLSNIDTQKLAQYIDTNSNPKINQQILRKLINFKLYPIIVVVNYRSKYIPQLPDEVDFEKLKQRTVKNENDYKNGIISQDIYIQEKNLISFLEVFAQLKLDVNNYELDYKAKITEDYSIELFIILQDFWRLKNFYRTIYLANKGNPLFDNEFKPIYEMFLTKAELYLEANASLRNIKELVNLIFDLENTPTEEIDSAKREEFLRKLYSIELPERELYSDEAKTIRKWIDVLENIQYNQIYKPIVDDLSKKPVDDQTYDEVKQLQNQISNSACQLCREKVSAFITSFYQQYDKYVYDKELDRFKKLKTQGKTFAYKSLEKYDCIKQNLDSVITSQSVKQMLNKDLENIDKQIKTLLNLVSTEQAKAFNELKTTNNTIETLIEKIDSELKAICNQNQKLCNCEK